MSGESFRVPRTHGHDLCVYVTGALDAPPVLLLHGGPGGGAALDHARHHDLTSSRLVQFDQRGTGRSSFVDPLEANTTADQIGDIEAVREAVGVSSWTVAGGSWGALLAVLYAETHPAAVERLVLRSVFLGRNSDQDWLVRAETPAPLARRRVVELVGGGTGRPFAELDRRLTDPLDVTAGQAAAAWAHLERVLSGLADDEAEPTPLGPRQLLDVRIEMHYLAHRFFVPHDHAAASATALSGIPGVILHGDDDQVIAPDAADHLARTWRAGQVRRVRRGGHSLASAEMRTAWEHALREPAHAVAGGGR